MDNEQKQFLTYFCPFCHAEVDVPDEVAEDGGPQYRWSPAAQERWLAREFPCWNCGKPTRVVKKPRVVVE
jgi:hypothetical protein